MEAGPDEVIAVSPAEMHDGAPVGGARAWDMLYVAPETVARLAGPEAGRREFGFAACGDARLVASVNAALSALAEGEALEAEEALTALFATVLSPTTGEGPPVSRGGPSQVTRRVQARIADQPDDPPTLDEVAALMGMGRTGALRRFRRETGATPHAYAMQLRLRRARQALMAGDSAAEVALAYGFADQAHLTRAFARQFGLPPGRWRAGGTKGNIVQDGDTRAAP